MHYFVGMQVTQSYYYLGSNEFSDSFRKAFSGEEVVIEVASSDVFEEEVDAVLVLEDKVHGENEGVVSLEQYVLFILGVLDLVFVY